MQNIYTIITQVFFVVYIKKSKKKKCKGQRRGK